MYQTNTILYNKAKKKKKMQEFSAGKNKIFNKYAVNKEV